MSIVIDYENLLVLGGVADLNLKRFDVELFKRFLESELCEIGEMG
jgi:hypothetical protein